MVELYIVTLSALFSIVNPIGAVPVFLALTANETPQQRLLLVKKASFYIALILIVFFLGGTYILDFFGITVNGMRIAGGIIIMRSGLDLMSYKHEKNRSITKKVKEEAINKNDISFSPLAMPLLAGPGSIALLISISREKTGFKNYSIIILSIISISILVLLVLSVAPRLMKFLGESGSTALSRMMGFISLAIGVQFVANGVTPIMKTILR